MNFPVFDLHCDTAFAILGRDMRASNNLRKNNLHIDLERAALLDGYAQCFACFTTTWENNLSGLTVEDIFEREISVLMRELNANQDTISLAYNASDVVENYSNGLMSAILSIEGPAGFGFDPALLENLYQIGFRITTLGWNERNCLTGSHVTGGGLTDLGREYVHEAQRLGMVIDVSHISDEGFWDIMSITQAPVIASHSNSRSTFNASRNLSDDMFQAICQAGGVAGLNLYAGFVGENPNLDLACKHILHFLEIDPTGKHIALGGDLDGCNPLCSGFEGIQDYPKFAQVLIHCGVSEDTVQDLFWNNALRVLSECGK